MAEAYDEYVYPHSTVLINKGGYRDSKSAKEFEARCTRLRMHSLPDLPFTPEGYLGLHRHLFQDVWDWAGETRKVVTGKGDALFTFPDHIQKQLNRAFSDLKQQDHLRLRTLDEFAAGAAAHINALNRIHPFREGNGRVMRLHLRALCAKAGHDIDLRRIDAAEWHRASVEGISGSPSADKLMKELIVKAQASLAPPAPGARDSRGWGVDAASVAAAADRTRQVAELRDAMDARLARVYAEPDRARAAIDEMVARNGYAGAVEMLSKGPERVGPLRGAVGSKERADALHQALNGLPRDLAAIAERRKAAGRAYVAEVAEQIRFDADPLATLSPKARAALDRAAPGDDPAAGDRVLEREFARFMRRAERAVARGREIGPGMSAAAVSGALVPGAPPPEAAARAGQLMRAVKTLRAAVPAPEAPALARAC